MSAVIVLQTHIHALVMSVRSYIKPTISVICATSLWTHKMTFVVDVEGD